MDGIVHIRIDDRLIHGQVAAYWSNALQVNRIMVINDAVAHDELQKKVLRMAAPTGIATSLLTKAAAAGNIQAGKYAGQRVLVILKNPEDGLALIQQGLPIQAINVGNLGAREHARMAKKSIYVTAADEAAFYSLAEAGVKLTAQMVPDAAADDLLPYLDRLGGKK